jgi:exodeoxyribonuclease V alpha subunit
MYADSHKPFHVLIGAPTGKAAVRMVESIKDTKRRLKEDNDIDQNILDAIPERATTIHRLLGAAYQSPYFRHDARKPLTADMVIIDEVSMVDLPLMAKLLDALPKNCSLMLVGDVNQLASVEPGRVYGDVCQAASQEGPLCGCLTRLEKSRRFPATSAIGRISKLINHGDPQAWNVLNEASGGNDLEVLSAQTLATGTQKLAALVEEHLSGFLAAKKPEAALGAATRFRILCALRKGPYGVKRMNRHIETILSKKGLNPKGRFYDHQLIMINVNTPALGLYNGDVGVVLTTEGTKVKDKDFTAWFYDKDQEPIPIPVNLLPRHETAFAMTVHKSQGSEFPYMAMILPPDAISPILTRELLYTGITRVKIDTKKQTGKLTLWCSETSFMKALDTRTERMTGLFS